MSLFTVPISTGGSFECSSTSVPAGSKLGEERPVYLLTFNSPPDNRLTSAFLEAFVLALDIIEHQYSPGVVVSTSGIEKFYSNGLDLEHAIETEGFWEKLWVLFRRLLTYPMPTIALINGHAFAGGLMLSMFHDYRVQNPKRGFLCLNEIHFGAILQTPMYAIFREKVPANATFRSLVLEGHRFAGPEALERGIVDALGGFDEALRLIGARQLASKADTGVYGALKEDMYRHTLALLDGHDANVRWRSDVDEKKERYRDQALRRIEVWKEHKTTSKL